MRNLFMCFPGGLKKALTLSYDDGVEQDKRLIEIMVKNGIKGTFNLNSGCFAPEGTVYPEGTIHRRMSESEVKDLYTKNGMEVATHGFMHPFYTRMKTQLALKDIVDDRLALESLFDTIVKGHAYPFGTYNDEVVDILKTAGIVYARTVNSTHKFEIPTDWLRLNPTCHHDDPELFNLADKFIDAKDNWGHSMLFYLWGHAYEFEANNNWNRIEEFCEKISNKQDIWYATNIEVYNYVKAFDELVYDMNLTKVYNPTALTIWFDIYGKKYKVNPGETISLS